MLHFGTKRRFLEDPRRYVQEAKELRFQGDMAGALGTLRDGLSVFPESASLHRALGHELTKGNKEYGMSRLKADEAFQCFETAYRLDPHNFFYSFDYAQALQNAGRHEEAEGIFIAILDDLVLDAPHNFEILKQLGSLYHETGQDEWAVCCYHACTLINPQDVETQFALTKLEALLDIDDPTDNDWEKYLLHAQEVVNTAFDAGILLMFIEPENDYLIRKIEDEPSDGMDLTIE